MGKIFRPTRAEINLAALRRNVLSLLKKIHPAKLLFVVKADAYGHGAGPVSSLVEDIVWGFGVSSVEEGIRLREGGIRKPVLVLGSLYPFGSFMESAKRNLSVTVSSIGAARQAVEAARKTGGLRCHIKIETGMGRIGMRRPAAAAVFRYLDSHRREIFLEGAYSHLSSADTDRKYTLKQYGYYRDALRDFKNIPPGFIRHLCNSYAALHYPVMRMDLVRCGLACYGLMPGFEPVLSWKTKIVFIKNVRKGSFISYNKSFRARRAMKIATLPVGYADGLSRRLSGRARFLLRGKKCRVLGNITMDMTMIDITHVKDARIGDDVIMIGKSGKENIRADYLAEKSGTISYETVSMISSRVARIYK